MSSVKKKKSMDKKKKLVTALVKDIESSKTISIVNLEGLPAKTLKAMRAKLRGKIKFVFAKKTIAKRAFDAAKKEPAKQLVQHLEGINPALLFSDLDAFNLYRELKAGRQMVPAKPGQLAPSDITVHAGPTPFAPGPAISELAQLGLKTKVEGGKIHVRDSAVVVKSGDKISPVAASILAKLGVTPIQIGINLTYALENSDLYKGAILDIDAEKYAQDLKTAALNAFTLAVELGIVTKETAGFMVMKAAREAAALEKKLPKAEEKPQGEAQAN